MIRTTAPAGDVCVEDGCARPATHERPVGMTGADQVWEMVCEVHDIWWTIGGES